MATLEAHGLSGFFSVVNGLGEDESSKAQTLTRTLQLMGGLDPAEVLMVGDRGSDIVAGRLVGTRTVGVLWGYGSRAELEARGRRRAARAPARAGRPAAALTGR